MFCIFCIIELAFSTKISLHFFFFLVEKEDLKFLYAMLYFEKIVPRFKLSDETFHVSRNVDSCY